MKITVLTPDMSHNCLSRAYALAEMLRRRHEVEIAGPIFGEGIWPPLANGGSIPYKTVKVRGSFTSAQVLALRRLGGRRRRVRLETPVPEFRSGRLAQDRPPGASGPRHGRLGAGLHLGGSPNLAAPQPSVCVVRCRLRRDGLRERGPARTRGSPHRRQYVPAAAIRRDPRVACA